VIPDVGEGQVTREITVAKDQEVIPLRLSDSEVYQHKNHAWKVIESESESVL